MKALEDEAILKYSIKFSKEIHNNFKVDNDPGETKKFKILTWMI